MTRAQAWLAQAESDVIAGNHLASLPDLRMSCQAIAKYQQTIEKTTKGLVDALNDSNALCGRRHSVEGLLNALLLLPRSPRNKDVQNRIRGLYSEVIRADIRALDHLAPQWPAVGASFPRNTEYPFQRADGSWTAPAALGSFSPEEVQRFRDTANRLLLGSKKLIFALEAL